MKKFILYLILSFIIGVSVYVSLTGGRYDCVITNGKIVDGTGNPWYRGDIAVRNGKIAAVGFIPAGKAKEVIDASGKVVSPGFIDIHTHTDEVEDDPTAHNYIMQGVTTIISGNCGGSQLELKEFFRKLERQGMALNYGTLVGHGTVRYLVMGNEDREPNGKELEEMKRWVEQAMREGALGLSTGLEYTPGSNSSTDEIIELCKVVFENGGFYATHMRNEGDKVTEAIEEALEIGKKTNIPVEISHFKVIGVNNWGRSHTIVKMINDAREKGIDVTVDQYPYTAGSSWFEIMYPRWAQVDGGLTKKLKDKELRAKIKEELVQSIVNKYCGDDFNRIQLAIFTEDSTYEGKGLTDILKMQQREITPENAAELVMELSMVSGTMVNYHAMSENDVQLIMRNPTTMHASDGYVTKMNDGVPHPRSYGTFPRVLGVYVREKRILRLEDAVRKMTSMPANRIGIRDAGLLTTGKRADIVIFDPETIKDIATFQNPHCYPAGIDYVFVNGEIVVEKGNITGRLPGRVMYGQRMKNRWK